MKRHILAAMFVGGLAATPALAQNDGQTAFNTSCRTCHTMKEGDNRLGPNLAGIVGRKAGSLPDYNYSSSMKQSGITWDAATLDAYIADPRGIVPGTKMSFAGVRSPDDRAAIVAYLESL